MGQVPPKLLTFLQAAREQAADLKREFVATLIVSRRRQFAVVATCALLAGMISLVTMRSAQHARATWSTCPTLVPGPGEPGAPATSGESGTPGSSANPRALVPKDWRVVALPRDVIAPDVHPGDLVDLVSNAEIVASHAVVVTAAGDTTGMNVAVAPGSAPVVATAAQTGGISVLALG